MIIYGVPGIGKTSMAAYAPGAILLHDKTEDGITTLKNAGLIPKTIPQLPPANSWGDAIEMLDALATGEHSHRTLVVDAMGGFERLCHEEVCRRDFKGEWGERGFASYQKGPEVALTDWRQFLGALDRLRDEKRMGIVLLAHSKVLNFKNPEGPDFDTYTPDCDKRTWAMSHKWADAVLFLNYVIAVDKDGKAQTSNSRVIFTEYHPAYAAKNRHGLPPEIDMGESAQQAWNNLTAALKAGRKEVANG